MFIVGQIDFSHRHFRNEKGTELKFTPQLFLGSLRGTRRPSASEARFHLSFEAAELKPKKLQYNWRRLRFDKEAAWHVSELPCKCKKLVYMYFTVISPTDTFRGEPYFVVFWLAMSVRISGLCVSIPNVKIMTELLSSKFLSLIVWKIKRLSSVGSPSVRNKIILLLVLSDSPTAEAFNRSKAFSNPTW